MTYSGEELDVVCLYREAATLWRIVERGMKYYCDNFIADALDRTVMMYEMNVRMIQSWWATIAWIQWQFARALTK